jgi:hypothetical protein
MPSRLRLRSLLVPTHRTGLWLHLNLAARSHPGALPHIPTEIVGLGAHHALELRRRTCANAA